MILIDMKSSITIENEIAIATASHIHSIWTIKINYIV